MTIMLPERIMKWMRLGGAGFKSNTPAEIKKEYEEITKKVQDTVNRTWRDT